MIRPLIIVCIFSFHINTLLLGQIPNPSLPTPSLPSPNIPKNPLGQIQSDQQHKIQEQNARLMREGNNSADSRGQVRDILREEKRRDIHYEFPSYASVKGTELYREAYQELSDMLTGKKTESLKRAVFITENAYLEGKTTYDWFQSEIDASIKMVQSNVIDEGYGEDNDMAKKMMLHQFMSDTMYYRDDAEKEYTHLPFKYDFNDIHGKEDWRKMFVTKLLSTGSGQCHSMPLLYLILAEELNINAWLSFSPEHSYVRIKDDKNNWYNLEMTNGHYSTDTWILGSGFIKSEALRSGIYMDTLSKKETIAYCMVDLAKGYAMKYGLDNFVLDCLDKALEYHPNNIYALQLKSDYHSYLFQYVVHQLEYPKSEELYKYPKAFQLFLERNKVYRQIDDTGYEPMPQEIYEAWLKSLENEKGKQAKFPRA